MESADGFEAADDMFGIRGVALPFMAVVERGFAFVVADVVDLEVSDTAEKPSARVFDVVPMGVEFHKRILNEVFGSLPLADETMGIAEQWGFLRFEDLPECRFFLHGGSKRDHRIASGISLDPGAGGRGFHESARAFSCLSSIKTQPADFS